MPEYVCFDSWYSGLENLKHIRRHHWHWFTRLKSNRLVNPDGNGNVAIAEVEVGCEGCIVHLKYYGFIKVFKTVSTNGSVEYWATSNLNMTEIARLSVSEKVWVIENYHRGLKQFTGVEKCQCRSATAQRNHIGYSIVPSSVSKFAPLPPDTLGLKLKHKLFVTLSELIYKKLYISCFQLRNS